MPAFITIVRYVPDVVRGECVNIGVIAFFESQKKVQFLSNWNRVKCLGGNPTAIRAACAELERVEPDKMFELIKRWRHSIQLSEPLGSTRDLNTLLIDAAQRYLVDPEVTDKGYKTRDEVVRSASRALRLAIRRSISRAAANALVHDDGSAPLQGALESHTLDITVHNGKPLLGASAFSFEAPNQKRLRQQLDSTKWAIEDIRAADPDVELTVIVTAPSPENKPLFDHSVKVFQSLKAEVRHDTDVESWAEQTAGQVQAHLPPHLFGRSN